MVSKLQLQSRRWISTLTLLGVMIAFGTPNRVWGAADEMLANAQSLYQSGQYFKAARYAFSAAQEDPSKKAVGYSWVTLGLSKAGLYHAASYFFIKTLQLKDIQATRRVLSQTEDLLLHASSDLLRKYLAEHTVDADYDRLNRSAFSYAMGKDLLLKGQVKEAIGYLNRVEATSPLWVFALQLRATSHAIAGNGSAAIEDFRRCVRQASSEADKARSRLDDSKDRSDPWLMQSKRQAEDLMNRCRAGIGRTYYQMDRFADADRAYDEIPKSSLIWTDILFEQAWNSFARDEFNRSLGKLVSYKSPALQFVFNSEIDVLRAQSFLALCLYSDANQVINEFNSKYARVSQIIKNYVEKNSGNMGEFFDMGKRVLKAGIRTENDFSQIMNRFVRSPYFVEQVETEAAVNREWAAIQRFDANQPGVTHNLKAGFPGFLAQVLNWKKRAARQLGGGFVKNSLIDYHSTLISDFEKTAFIKLEMLARAKEKLMNPGSNPGGRARGNVEPIRRNDQYYWGFNGEFWNDELGDYVFGLESECNSDRT